METPNNTGKQYTITPLNLGYHVYLFETDGVKFLMHPNIESAWACNKYEAEKAGGAGNLFFGTGYTVSVDGLYFVMSENHPTFRKLLNMGFEII